jgi:hypothetical protein
MCSNLTSSGGVVQSPNFPGDYGNNYLWCEVSITAQAEWMIQLNFTTLNLESGSAKLYVRKIKRNFSVQCSDSNFIWHSQVNDSVTIISSASDNTLVPATTKEMVILFYFSRSNKPTSAVYNWRATFSVTVFHLHQQSPWNFSCVVTLSFLFNFDRAKGVLVPRCFHHVTSIHSMNSFKIQILKR